MSDILLHFAAAAGYAAARIKPQAVIIALFLHAAALLTQYLNQPRFDIGIVLSLFTLAAIGVGWTKIYTTWTKTLMQLFGIIGALSPLFINIDKAPPPPLIFIHIIPTLFAYAFAVLAIMQWGDLMIVEYRQRRLLATAAPPLLTIEAQCFSALKVAFILLFISLISGGGIAIFSTHNQLPPHKLIFALLSWLTFGAVLWGRWKFGWRERSARWGLALGIIFFILSYFGTHFVLQILLDRLP